MKHINNYLIEKLRLDKNIKVSNVEPPKEVDIDEFSNWLQLEFDFTKSDINALKRNISTGFKLEPDEYSIADISLFFRGEVSDQKVKMCFDEFPNLPKHARKFFSIESKKTKNKITGVICHGEWMLYDILFISNNDKLLYTYILNIILG